MSIRPAKESDLDAITWISVAATPADPVCPYRYPLRELYPDDFEKFSRIRLGEYFAGAVSGASDFLVFEAPSIDNSSVKKVVAFSIWDLPQHDLKMKEDSSAPDTVQHQAQEEEKRKSPCPSPSASSMYYSKINASLMKLTTSFPTSSQAATNRPPRTPRRPPRAHGRLPHEHQPRQNQSL